MTNLFAEGSCTSGLEGCRGLGCGGGILRPQDGDENNDGGGNAKTGESRGQSQTGSTRSELFLTHSPLDLGALADSVESAILKLGENN